MCIRDRFRTVRLNDRHDTKVSGVYKLLTLWLKSGFAFSKFWKSLLSSSNCYVRLTANDGRFEKLLTSPQYTRSQVWIPWLNQFFLGKHIDLVLDGIRILLSYWMSRKECSHDAVSYTHLDVYKRQRLYRMCLSRIRCLTVHTALFQSLKLRLMTYYLLLLSSPTPFWIPTIVNNIIITVLPLNPCDHIQLS